MSKKSISKLVFVLKEYRGEIYLSSMSIIYLVSVLIDGVEGKLM